MSRPEPERTSRELSARRAKNSSGVSARELLERRNNLAWLTPHALEHWLLSSGFAERNGGPGLLIPTAAGRFAGAGLDFLG